MRRINHTLFLSIFPTFSLAVFLFFFFENRAKVKNERKHYTHKIKTSQNVSIVPHFAHFFLGVSSHFFGEEGFLGGGMLSEAESINMRASCAVASLIGS